MPLRLVHEQSFGCSPIDFYDGLVSGGGRLRLIRLLEVIGEAANTVSSDLQARHAEVPWRKMTGLRNRLIHGYFNVDLDIVWDTLRTELPALILLLERVLELLETGST